jgi:tetratricopeptide (TPR) repeat protein
MMFKHWVKKAGLPVFFLLMVVGPASPVWSQYHNEAVTNPKGATYWLDQGGLLATYGNYRAALEAYKKALALDANNSKAYYDMSLAHAALGQLDQAREEINRAIALDPAQDRYYYARAWILLRAGRTAEADENFHKAAEMGNPDAIAYLQR